MRECVVSGISHRFRRLSRSEGQITHVLLTRSPLVYSRKGLTARLACVKHAASVRPEPGSNSPLNAFNRKQHPPTIGASIALITSTTNNTNKHGTNKNQHTVEFSKNKHTPSRTTLPWTGLGQLVQSTERDTWCQLAGTALHRARLAGDHEGLQRRRVTGSCPPRLGCRS